MTPRRVRRTGRRRARTRAGTRGGRRPGTARTRPARTAAERSRRAPRPRRATPHPSDRWNRATVTRPRAAPALLPRAGRCVPYPVARRRASRRKKVKRPRTDPYPTRNPTAPRTTGGSRIRPIRAPHHPARARDADHPFRDRIRLDIRLTSGARGTRAPQQPGSSGQPDAIPLLLACFAGRIVENLKRFLQVRRPPSRIVVNTRSRYATRIGRVPGESARAYEPLDSAERAALHHIRAAAHRVTESETRGRTLYLIHVTRLCCVVFCGLRVRRQSGARGHDPCRRV